MNRVSRLLVKKNAARIVLHNAGTDEFVTNNGNECRYLTPGQRKGED